MRTKAGLPGWFPEDFSTDPELLAAFEDDSEWHAAGGKGKSGDAHQHATSWDDISGEIELATVIDLYNPAGNPGQARVPAGQAGGGQFTKGQQQQQAGGKQAKGKKAAPTLSPAQQKARQKAALLKEAGNDRRKAAGILKQITALQKVIAAAQKGTGKTVSAKSNVTKSNAPAKTAATAATTASNAASSTASSGSSAGSTASKTASTTASKTAAAAAARKRLGPLQQQYKTLMHQAAVASAQAAKL